MGNGKDILVKNEATPNPISQRIKSASPSYAGGDMKIYVVNHPYILLIRKWNRNWKGDKSIRVEQ